VERKWVSGREVFHSNHDHIFLDTSTWVKFTYGYLIRFNYHLSLSLIFVYLLRSRKIILQCDNTDQLNELATKAEGSGLPYSKIEDAGFTQIPAGSQTVLAIFGVVSDVDKVTGHLKLYP